MGLRRGRCKSYGGCHHADDRKELEVDELNFVCPNPDCGAPLFPSIENGGRTRREIFGGWWLGVTAGLLLVFAAGWYFLLESPPAQTGNSLAEWMADGPKPPEIRSIMDNLKARTARIGALKQARKVVGSEFGLLNPASGVILSAAEQDLLNPLCQGRCRLFLTVFV